jgi:hypothetical protein
MTRANTTKLTIKVPRARLVSLIEICDYQTKKLEYYTSKYGDVELFYGKWRNKEDEKKNNI